MAYFPGVPSVKNEVQSESSPAPPSGPASVSKTLPDGSGKAELDQPFPSVPAVATPSQFTGEPASVACGPTADTVSALSALMPYTVDRNFFSITKFSSITYNDIKELFSTSNIDQYYYTSGE